MGNHNSSDRDHIIEFDNHLSNKFMNKVFKEWCIMQKYKSSYKYLDLDYRIATSKPISALDYDWLNNDALYKINVDIYDINSKKFVKDCICDIKSDNDLEAKEKAIESITGMYLGGNSPFRNADIKAIRSLYRKVGINDISNSPYISILKNGDNIYGFYLIDVIDRIAINFNKYLD